jgi:hypothetical protein
VLYTEATDAGLRIGVTMTIEASYSLPTILFLSNPLSVPSLKFFQALYHILWQKLEYDSVLLRGIRRQTSPVVLTMYRQVTKVSSWLPVSTLWDKSSPNRYTSFSCKINNTSCTRAVPTTPLLTLALSQTTPIP